MFDWLFKKNNGEELSLLNVIALNANRIHLAQLAEEKAINMIANAIAKSEIVLSDGQNRRKDIVYYRLNIRPNNNQTGTDFWHNVVRTLMKTNECVIVRLADGMFYMASGWSVSNQVAKRKTYTNVQITDGVDTMDLRRTFTSDDVIHLKYGSTQLRMWRESVLDSYNKAAEALNEMVTVAGTPRFKYKVNANMSFRTRDESGKDIVLTIDQVISKLEHQLSETGVKVIRETEGTSLEYLDMKSNIPTNELKTMTEQINELCAMAFDIPIDVFLGKITEKSDATNELITYAVQPIAETISDSLNAKLVGDEDYIRGERAFVWMSRFKHVDVIDSASSLDKLRGIGFSFDEIREMVGYDQLNTEWSQKRALTKNYAMEGEEEGAADGPAEDPAEESIVNTARRLSKHKERRKARYEGTEKVLSAG